jgi:hypothetical protein
MRIVIICEGNCKFVMAEKIHLVQRLALWVFLLLCVAGVRAQQAEPLSNLEFHSSNSTLDESFKWAKQQALDYVSARTGTIGPWYEAALPGRNAFCMRDVSHQTEGAAALGLFAANHNMLGRFAASATASRDWAGFWEIDGDGKPSTFDYVSDDDFWFNLPANFDVLDAAVRMWRWTGDDTYQDDPQFQRFFRATLSDYVERWQLQPASILARQRIANRRLSKGKFVDSRGIPSYTEGTADFTVGADLLAAEYRAIRSYSEIAVGPQDKALSAQMQRGAGQLQRILEKIVWVPEERHFYGRIRGDRSGAGSGDALVLYFGAAKDSERIRGALDYVANPKYWGQINIEEETYVPIVLFRYGRSADAYKVLFDMTRPDKPRREYPEVSYAAVAAIVSGAMGIEPSRAGDNFDLRTLALPLDSTDDLAVTSLQIRKNILDIKHTGRATTSIVNRQGPALRWKAEFAETCGRMRVNDKPVRGIRDSLPGGVPLCSTIVAIPAGSSGTVTMR